MGNHDDVDSEMDVCGNVDKDEDNDDGRDNDMDLCDGDDDDEEDDDDDDDDCPTSHLPAYTFLPASQICLGFNLKMIEAFPDGPSNSKYNSQRTAGADEI